MFTLADPAAAREPGSPLEPFSVSLDVRIRPCRRDDLPALEWFGMFEPDRALIRRMFRQQVQGDALMLVAEVNGEASGQLWIELARRRAQGVGEIWAVRVLPCLQGRGIGTRMMHTAEALLRQRGYRVAELSVELDNPQARQLYERLGYRLVGTGTGGALTGAGRRSRSKQWVMAKELA